MQLEYFFDFSCPYAYLGSTQVEELAERCGAKLEWKPMLLGGVFRAVGTAQNMGAGMPPGKARHNIADMHRWADLWDVPFRLPAAHPMRTVAALRAVLSLDRSRWPEAIHSIYETYWVAGEDIADPDVLRGALARSGQPEPQVERAIAANDDTAIKNQLRRLTDEAVERGVFGAPAMFVDGELYWGQDRLDFVAEALGGDSIMPPCPPPSAEATIDFYFDFSSPFAYLASTEIEEVAASVGATLRWRPFLLGALFREIGTPNVPLLAAGEAKRAYYRKDIHRWAKRRDVPLFWNSHFPLRTVAALRLALLAPTDQVAPLIHAIFRAAWAQNKTLDDNDLRAIASECGVDPALVDATKEPEAKALLFDANRVALDRGVFGAPTSIVSVPGKKDALFWGQDRLELVRRAACGAL